MKKLKVYAYANCSTCKNALKFLEKKKVAFEVLPIVETPPTLAELKKMLAIYEGKIGKLFNTSGLLYREMGLGEKLKGMTETAALTLLSKHGKLVQLPFALSDTRGVGGFKEPEWKTLLD